MRLACTRTFNIMKLSSTSSLLNEVERVEKKMHPHAARPSRPKNVVALRPRRKVPSLPVSGKALAVAAALGCGARSGFSRLPLSVISVDRARCGSLRPPLASAARAAGSTPRSA